MAGNISTAGGVVRDSRGTGFGVSPLRRRGSTRECAKCGAPMVAIKTGEWREFCDRCVGDAWQTVYDRDRRIGAIPENLRRDYRL
jgi:hypothetical protein